MESKKQTYFGTGDFDVTDSQFQSMSEEAMKKMMDQDAGPMMSRPTDNESFSVVVDSSALGPNETIGGYFIKHSQLPDGQLSTLWGFDRPSQARLTISRPSSGRPSAKHQSMSKETTKKRMSHPTVRESFSETVNSSALGRDVSGSDRDSITNYFSSSKSDGISADDIMDRVMKYCKEKCNANPPVQPVPPSQKTFNGDDTFTPGIMDVSSMSNFEDYSSIHHSTPKRNSKPNTYLSLQNLNETKTDGYGKYFLSDLLPKLSNLNVTTTAPARPSMTTPRLSEHTAKPKSRPSTKSTMTQTSSTFVHPQAIVERETETEPSTRNTSPNSSISSTGTSVSNAATQCQLVQIHAPQQQQQQHSSGYGLPIFVQMQVPNNHHHGAITTHIMCSQNSLQNGPAHSFHSACTLRHPHQGNMCQTCSTIPLLSTPVPVQVYPPFIQSLSNLPCSNPHSHCHCNCNNCCGSSNCQ